MYATLLALVLLEGVLLVLWCRPWWPWGVTLFSRRLPVPASLLLDFPDARLQADLQSDQWPDLLVRRLDRRSFAFRESFGFHFGWRYPPMMRGMIFIDVRRRELRIVGRSSWTVLFVVASFIPALAVAPGGVVVVALIFAASYLVQRHRFLAVETAIRGYLDPRA